MNPPPFSKSCARISAELIAVEIERYLERLADSEYLAFLVALYRLALADDESQFQQANAAAAQSAYALASIFGVRPAQRRVKRLEDQVLIG